MASYRQLQTEFWQDDFVAGLTPEERYFYIYLMTNPRTKQCGIFKIVIKFIAIELGYDNGTVEKLIEKFVDYGKILYSPETNELMIVNWMKYNYINSKNTLLCINKELKQVKNKEFVKKFYDICVKRNYDLRIIFRDIDPNDVDPSSAGTASKEIIDKNIEKEEINENSDFSTEGDSPSESISMPLEAPCKPLGEEEIKKEIYINNKSSYTQKVINNNLEESGFEERETEDISKTPQEKENSAAAKNKSVSRVLFEFNKNIKQASILEIEKFKLWIKDFEEDLIIKAIEEAVKYNAKHIGYIDSILKNYKAKGITTIKALDKKINKPQRFNEAAYRYVD